MMYKYKVKFRHIEKDGASVLKEAIVNFDKKVSSLHNETGQALLRVAAQSLGLEPNRCKPSGGNFDIEEIRPTSSSDSHWKEEKKQSQAEWDRNSKSLDADLDRLSAKTPAQIAAEAQAALEQEKYDDEMRERRRLQELEEKKAKQKRADELRAQGKNTQAFLLEHGKTVGLVGAVVVICIIGLVMFINQNGNEKLDADLTRKAETIETLIHDRKKEEASKLIEELQHDSQSESKHSAGLLSNYTYFEYWTKRRGELKTLADNMPTTQPPSEVEPQQQTTAQTQSQPETSKYSNFLGEWKGAWGPSYQMSIVIEEINESDKTVIGYSETTSLNNVKDGHHRLIGSINGENEFYLNGVKGTGGTFKFSIAHDTLHGTCSFDDGKEPFPFLLTK